jgi:D-alanyl-D-alanine dipeptidase
VIYRAPHFVSKYLPALALLPLLLAARVSAQTDAPAPLIEPGVQPPDVRIEWKQLVGIYAHDDDTIVILERAGALYYRAADSAEYPLHERAADSFTFANSAAGSPQTITLSRNAMGSVSSFAAADATYMRADAGADAGGFYRVTPAHPLDVLRAEALRAAPPAESGPFRKPDLVELTTLDPAFRLDIRYAQSNNFLGSPVYSQARAFMQRPAAVALVRALHQLHSLGYGLLIHDAYRPWYVTKIFWDATPVAGHIFVADPQAGSKHNRGCAVDLTLYDLSSGRPIEMPGLYDEMSARSFPEFPGGTSLQRWHRELLRRAMEAQGFTVDEHEWWHFDYKDWKQYPILNIAFESLSGALQH